MQARRGRGDSPGLIGEKRLIISGIVRIVIAPRRDIGRQRHVADARDGLIQRRAGEVEAEQSSPRLAFLNHLGVERAEQAGGAFAQPAEAHALADIQLFGGPHEGPPALRRLALMQSRLDPRDSRAAPPRADEPRRNHACVVDDERVTRLEERWKIKHGAVRESRRARLDAEQPRRVSGHAGPQRDALRRQVEVEEIDAHGCLGARRPPPPLAGRRKVLSPASPTQSYRGPSPARRA